MKKFDHIYSTPKNPLPPFSFNQEVALAFDDMVNRSVPLYQESQKIILELLRNELKQNEVVYDLGSSTGTTLLNINQNLSDLKLELFGIEASKAMVDLSIEKCAPFSKNTHFLQMDLESFIPFECGAVISHYTMQFIQKNQRLQIIKNFHDKLRSNGLFILSEKVKSSSDELNALFIKIYHDFKKNNGYSELEIQQKSKALKGVLEPLTIEENMDLLSQAGFKRIEVVLKWYNFATIIAYKD